MNNEMKIWLCEQYAQKAWALSLNLAQEAARAGHLGKGYAVVADETRNLAEKLFAYASEAKFGNGNENLWKGIMDVSVETGFLSVNMAIEKLHIEAAHVNISHTGVAVCADDVRNLALKLGELAEKPVWNKPFVLPEITSPLRSTRTTDFFFRFSIGGAALVENVLNVKEVCHRRKEDVSGETFSLRGHTLPLIDSRRCANADKQTVLIINPEDQKYRGYRDNDYAVPIDDLDVNTIFRSRIGRDVPPKNDHAFAGFARECWDVVGGDQLIFIDWLKLIAK